MEQEIVEETKVNKNVLPRLDKVKITKYFKNQVKPDENSTTKWVDDLFPPAESSLLSQEYKNKKLRPEQENFIKTEIVPDKIEWKRFSDVNNSGFNVFESSIEIADIKQGGLSDCYLLSALASLTEFPEHINQRIITKDPSNVGCYEVLLFVDGEWQIVLVDDFFPYEKGTQGLSFTKVNGTEMWVILLEKAWAKINGGYANIVLGLVSDAFQALTGFSVEYFPTLTSQKTPLEIWEILKNSDSTDYIMCTATKNEKLVEDYGLIAGHAYTLVGAKEVLQNDSPIQLLQLFNPWGRKEWTGSWSDNSSNWDPELIQKFGKKSADDGQFFIEVKDYKEFYESLFICHMMYGATIKNYFMPYEHAKKANCFMFKLEDDCRASISVFFKNWRTNRELENQIRPFTVAVAKVKELKGEKISVESISVESTESSDIQIIKRFAKGYYVVWLNGITDDLIEQNFSYNFRICADLDFECFYAGEDTNYDILKYLIIQNKMKLNSDGKKPKTDISIENNDTTFKKLGLISCNAINYSKKEQVVEFTISDYNSYKILSNNEIKKNDKLTVNILPNASHIVIAQKNPKKGAPEIFTAKGTKKSSKEPSGTYTLNDEFMYNIINLSKDVVELSTQNFTFPSVKDLKFVKKFAKMGQRTQEYYSYEELINIHAASRDELLELLKSHNKDYSKFKVVEESSGTYIGETPPDKGKIYYGVRYIENERMYYVGPFKDGLYTGEGKLYKNGKLLYEGTFREGKKDKIGSLFSEDRNIFKGTFILDRIKGLTRIYHENTNSLSIGFMDNDKMHGYAIEVNYPQRNTRVCFYKDGLLINFKVVEYEFFKKTWETEKFLNVKFPDFATQFLEKLKHKLNTKEDAKDLISHRIWDERSHNKSVRAKKEFMYDMLRELSYNYITQISEINMYRTNHYLAFEKRANDLFYSTYVEETEDILFMTMEKTDKVYWLAKPELRVYIFFLGVENSKPLYDKNVRWLVYNEQQELLFEGGYDMRLNGKYYNPSNGEFLHTLVSPEKAFFYYPDRGYAYGDYDISLGEKSSFNTYYWNGLYNNYIHIRQLIPVTEKVEKTEGESKGVEKRYDYFIPKKEAEELLIEKFFDKESFRAMEGQESEKEEKYTDDAKKIIRVMRTHFPFFFTFPINKAAEDSEDLSFFKIEINNNKIDPEFTEEVNGNKIEVSSKKTKVTTFIYPIYQETKTYDNHGVKHKIKFVSTNFDKSYGIYSKAGDDNYEYIGAIRDNKRHGSGVEQFNFQEVDKDTKKNVTLLKNIHMTFNENERDGYNFEYDSRAICDAFYYNDGIKCSESLNLVIYEDKDIIDDGEDFEKTVQRRAEEQKAKWDLIVERLTEKGHPELAQLLIAFDEAKIEGEEKLIPGLKFYCKHTVEGYYLGEVDHFYQANGRGIILYNTHSMKNGKAYVGYWKGGVKHGHGIDVDFNDRVTLKFKNPENKKTTYFSVEYYINEHKVVKNEKRLMNGTGNTEVVDTVDTNMISLKDTNNEIQHNEQPDRVPVKKSLNDKMTEFVTQNGWVARDPLDFTYEINENEDLKEHDPETGETTTLVEKLESFQWFASLNDDICQNHKIGQMAKVFDKVANLNKLFVES